MESACEPLSETISYNLIGYALLFRLENDYYCARSLKDA